MTASALKIIAMAGMIIDHVGAVFFPGIPLLRIIGRVSFPIFCFLITEGYKKTSNIHKYMIRLLLCGFLSEIPFDMVFYGRIALEHQNVLFTLLAGIAAVYALDKMKNAQALVIVLVLALGAQCLGTDYGAYGVLLIVLFYMAGENVCYPLLKKNIMDEKMDVRRTILVAVPTVYQLIGAYGIQRFSAVSTLFIAAYNGKKGKFPGRIFYLFYPVHLIVIAIILQLQYRM